MPKAIIRETMIASLFIIMVIILYFYFNYAEYPVSTLISSFFLLSVIIIGLPDHLARYFEKTEADVSVIRPYRKWAAILFSLWTFLYMLTFWILIHIFGIKTDSIVFTFTLILLLNAVKACISYQKLQD